MSLVLRLREASDQAAWAEFLEIYEPLVLRLLRSRGLQEADAREVAQEVFLAVARAVERWEPNPDRGSFRGWLARITRNLMINYLARQHRHPRADGRVEMHELLSRQPANDASSRWFDHERQKAVFGWAADQVREEFRASTWEAFWQTAVAARPAAEVAREIGLSLGALYVAKSRVMARLRAKVEEHVFVDDE